MANDVPKTKKVFISYRSSDAPQVDKIERALSMETYDDGTPRYTTWQDKRNLPAGVAHWWDAIVEAIVDCDVFAFHVSRDSLESKVCLAELDYAQRRNRPIIPIVIEGSFIRHEQSGKYDINYWNLIPASIKDRQFLFQIGPETITRFNEAVERFERNWPRDLPASAPLDPTAMDTEYQDNHHKYAIACECAERLAFAQAEALFKNLIDRNDPDYSELAYEWVVVIRQYDELIKIRESEYTSQILHQRWQDYVKQFSTNTISRVFDPRNINPENKEPSRQISTPKTYASVAEVQAPVTVLPEPFEWITLPAKDFSIAKYPITNAQFALFIEADGYNHKSWWTQAGWKARNIKNWTEPKHWQDAAFNAPMQPVVGVSWYEAMAFCSWLSEKTGEHITLPTAEQWCYAAQGDEKRLYPWGNSWSISNCQNSIADGYGSAEGTSIVTHYEFVGDSAFDVVDMVGNVWEWCLTDFDTGADDAESDAEKRTLYGGSWRKFLPEQFQCTARNWYKPHNRSDDAGFRIVRLD